MQPERDLAAFDARATTYERGWLGRLHHDIADRTADLAFSICPDPRQVLDVGCGTGYLLRSLASRYPDADKLSGVDAAPAMIEVATGGGPATTGSPSPWGRPNTCPTPMTPSTWR